MPDVVAPASLSRWRETATLAYLVGLHQSKPPQLAAAADEHAQAAAVQRKQSLALAILIFGGLVVASSGVFVRLSQTGPTATAFWRGALALPVFALWILIDSRRKSPQLNLRALTPPDSRLFWAGACFGADLLFWHWSLLLTSIAASTLEANLAPMVVTLIAWIAWKERPSGKFLFALALALGGVGLIVSPKLGNHEGALLGDVLGLLTACFYGGYLAIVSRLRSAYSTGVVMFWTTFFYSLLLLPIALTQPFLPQDLHGWSLLLGLALIVHCLGQGLVAYALAHLPAAFGAVGLLVQPTAAAFYAWLFLGEQFAPIQFVGGAVVLCAILLARNASSPPRVEPVQNRAP